MTKVRPLPNDVQTAIDQFFESPIKVGLGGKEVNILLTSVRHDEAVALAQLVLSEKPKTSLEVGMAAGGSSVAIGAARRHLGLAPHVVLDPFQHDFGNIGLAEVEKAGLNDWVQWLPEYGETFLFHAFEKGTQFDFVFLDGGKTLGHVLTLTFLADRVVKPGGMIVFHDSLIESHAISVRYLVRECGYTIVALPNAFDLRTVARMGRYAKRLGFWYSRNVIPHIFRSVAGVRKPLLS